MLFKRGRPPKKTRNFGGEKKKEEMIYQANVNEKKGRMGGRGKKGGMDGKKRKTQVQ